MKNILVVVESIDVDDSSGSKVNVALIKNLKMAGFHLRVYHYTLKNICIPGVDCIAIKENRRSILFYLSRTERYLRDYLKLNLHKPLQRKFGFSFTLFNDRNSIVKAIKRNKNFDPDLVLTLSKGGSFRPHHALLQLPDLHNKWMAYMHDPYPMHHYPKPYTWFEPGYCKKQAFVDRISQKAAFSAFPSQLLLEWMGNFYPAFLKSGIVVPHQMSSSDPWKAMLPAFFDPKKFNLLHAGNLLGARNPEHLIEAFVNFVETTPGAKEKASLVFVGGNNERLMNRTLKHPNVFASTSYINFDQVFRMQTETAVNIIIEAKADYSPFLPGKFPHCIQARKPILLLGPEKSESRRLLGNDYVYWSQIDDVKKMEHLIGRLYQQWKESSGNLGMERRDLEEYMSYRNLQKILTNLVQEP